uniref:B30.2/SPRY domain-containing protein n=1 Tax=Dromaius novaehollandiae TaxID=8790 RepID=A0A8C4JL78_DRONO
MARGWLGSAVSTLPGEKAGQDGTAGEDEAARGLGSLVLNAGKAASARPLEQGSGESGKDEICCDSCLAEEVQVVKPCLGRVLNYDVEHLQLHLGNGQLQGHGLAGPARAAAQQSRTAHGGHLRWFCRMDLACVCTEMPSGRKKRKQVSDGCLICLQDELLQMQMEYDQKLKSDEDAILKLQNNTQSIMVRQNVGLAEGQSGLLLEAVRSAQLEVVAFLEEEEHVAVNHVNGIRMHLEDKGTLMKENKLKPEKMAALTNNCLFLKTGKNSRLDALPSVYTGLKDKLSGIRRLVLASTGHLPQLLQTLYKEKPQDFTKEDEIALYLLVYISAKLTTPWEQPYLDHPERFGHWRQVLSDKSLYFGRYYFEVEISGPGIYLGMTYKNIDQKGSESSSCISGNDFSWSIMWNGKGFSAWNSDVETPLATDVFNRIGICLNYPCRTLSFYGVISDDMTLIHQFECEFAELLYPAFWLSKKENYVRIIRLGEDAEKTLASLPPSGEAAPSKASESEELASA